MHKTHQTAVVIVPPHTLWTPIQAIRRDHDRHFRRWMPHITLLYPFRPRSEWDSILHLLEQACLDIAPFTVELRTLRTFRHGSNYTLWLAPEPNEPLVALQTSLWRVVPDCDDTQRHTNGFTPHLSIGQVRGHGARGRLTAELQAAWMPVRFSISDVQLIWRGDPPDDVFQIGERIVLGHSSAPSV